MIPLKLELKNFLSYGEPLQTIDFQNHALVCLSGKNGHGKSALLDAITWALWGQARKTTGTAKADEGLLKLGQTRMLVSLEFAFNGKIYRVRREFAKTYGKPHAALDFDIFDPLAEKFVSLTDKTIRATQAKIEQLIGLDFETFTNSAFLRQGQSNEFSKKSPKERKQILSSILGLEKYDCMHQKALDFVRKYADDKKLLLKIQDSHLADIAKENDILALLSKEKEETIRLNQSLQESQEKLTKIEHQKLSFDAEKKAYDSLTKQLQDVEAVQKTKTDNLTTIINAWKHAHAASLKLPDLKSLEEKKWGLIKQEKQFIETQQKQLIFQEKILQGREEYQKQYALLQKTSEEALFNLRMSLEKQDITIKHLQASIQQKEVVKAEVSQKIIALEQELITLNEKDKAKDEFAQKFAVAKAQFEKRRTVYQTLIQKGNWTKNELSELEQKKKVVHDHTNPACPLCEQILTVKRKQFLSNQLAEHEKFLNYRLGRVGTLIKKLKDLLVEQHQDIERFQKEADIFASLANKQKDVAQHIEVAEKEYKALVTDILSLTQQQKDLATTLLQNKELLKEQEQYFLSEHINNPALNTLKQNYEQLEKEKNTLVFDRQAYQQIQTELAQIEHFLMQLETIKSELGQQNTRKNTIQRLCYELKALKQQLQAIHLERSKKNIDPEREKFLLDTITSHQKEMMALMQQKEAIMLAVGSHENELQRIQKTKDQQRQNNEKLRILDIEIEDYQTIAQALSKNGIQALLIEEAIPEIEAEANTILARLTDNQAQIFIESLRDLKSGGVKETLDIQISDAIGIRPYEMFSGGEAFRVDFALRIAISKLLARRSGTALQTLIIDEGFGSQDDEGLARIMEAIYAIQKDFSKIIIVSHLIEFKDNFPVHFIIEKNSSGSTVSVEERG